MSQREIQSEGGREREVERGEKNRLSERDGDTKTEVERDRQAERDRKTER